jgi:hypothetical protein
VTRTSFSDLLRSVAIVPRLRFKRSPVEPPIASGPDTRAAAPSRPPSAIKQPSTTPACGADAILVRQNDRRYHEKAADNQRTQGTRSERLGRASESSHQWPKPAPIIPPVKPTAPPIARPIGTPRGRPSKPAIAPPTAPLAALPVLRPRAAPQDHSLLGLLNDVPLTGPLRRTLRELASVLREQLNELGG